MVATPSTALNPESIAPTLQPTGLTSQSTGGIAQEIPASASSEATRTVLANSSSDKMTTAGSSTLSIGAAIYSSPNPAQFSITLITLTTETLTRETAIEESRDALMDSSTGMKSTSTSNFNPHNDTTHLRTSLPGGSSFTANHDSYLTYLHTGHFGHGGMVVSHMKSVTYHIPSSPPSNMFNPHLPSKLPQYPSGYCTVMPLIYSIQNAPKPPSQNQQGTLSLNKLM
ncbi:hypothetical protein M422DRAFT_239097 [Sphaerobolus stellatus SS14]|nr:hypothetical protein M422DRAFT_239097 [Sphaerobolus stellatus SS14]